MNMKFRGVKILRIIHSLEEYSVKFSALDSTNAAMLLPAYAKTNISTFLQRTFFSTFTFQEFFDLSSTN